MSGMELATGLGGLALFLYGMNMMSSGMEAAAGNKLKGILEKLTANRFLGVIAGALITAIIQSSSATTVMVVGFVNSGMMTLNQAVWVIMGANIGTTITGQLIALDVSAIAPIIAFLGVVVVVFGKKPKLIPIGNIFAGLGVLFIGMDMMSSAMMPLRDSEFMLSMMTKFSNPLLGILAGTAFTAIIQSSSASVGILQALAGTGVISFSGAVYVLFGQNIGTCITAVLASIGTNRNAKRSTMIHLSFNIIGTTLFTLVCIVSPLVSFVGGLTPDNPAAQIANMHTLFNIVTTLLLLPFGTLLVKLTRTILPDRQEEEEGQKLLFIKPIKKVEQAKFGASAIILEQTHQEIERMLTMARENVEKSFHAFIRQDLTCAEQVEVTEEYIDYLNKEILKYISKVMIHEKSPKGSSILSEYYNITGNVERISDHAMNISGYSKWIKEKSIVFTEEEINEVMEMQKICERLFDAIMGTHTEFVDDLSEVAALEQKIDDMTEDYRNNMLNRIKQGIGSEEGAILYSEMLTDFERIGDHALNISQEYAKIIVLES